MERRLQRLNWLTVRDLVPSKSDTVILPVGTVEAHGPTCLGTDNFIPEALATAIADRLEALVAPTLNYGITKSLYRYPGGISIKPETFGLFLHDILHSLVDTRFKNISVMNGHGGNNATLKNVAHDFHRRHRANIAVIHWFELCSELTAEFFGHAGGHGGTDETAMVQAIDTDLVDESVYSRDQVYQFRTGADVYPVPGCVLLYKEDEGYPEFDEVRSREYFDRVVAAVGDFTEQVVSRWRQLGL